MRAEEFKPLMARIEAWWPGTKWDDPMVAVWFEDLERFSAADVRAALERLKREHTVAFAPAIGALLAELEKPNRAETPTFEEMLALVYRAACRDGSERLEWLGHRAPLVAAFVRVQGEDRLFTMPLDDPEFGPLRRKELGEAWARFLIASEKREVATLARGDRQGLRRLDPFAVTSIEEGRKQLPTSEDA